MTKEIKEYLERESYDHATLADWYISSVGNEVPVWTEEHIEELLNDFYIIPRELKIKPLPYLTMKIPDEKIEECRKLMEELSQRSLLSFGLPRELIDEFYFPKETKDEV
jgi:hypothetical protein